jgi:hypothetical protein
VREHPRNHPALCTVVFQLVVLVLGFRNGRSRAKPRTTNEDEDEIAKKSGELRGSPKHLTSD